MKHLKRVFSLALALALALSMSVAPALAASESHFLTPEEAISLFSITVNTDVDTEVFIDEADAKTYYNPRWKNPRTNTGYFFVERDTTFTVTYLDDNPAADNLRLSITLTPYRLQADGSYVSALEEALFHPMMGHNSSYVETDYIYYCTDGTFHPQSECSLNSNYSTKPGAVLYTRETLKPGESATFTIPFDRFGDDADLMYEVEASISYPKSDGSSSSSYRYTRVILDEEAVAQRRAEQAAAASPTVAGFSDVHESDYFAEAVEWAVSVGVTTGTTDSTFSPAASVTRAQAVTFLWRAAGSPEPAATSSPFADAADQSAYYYKAVLWAAEQGITNGVSATSFGTDSPVTYDQMLAFMARAAGADTGSGDWSQAAIDWAAENGLTDGLTFSAKNNCPRADVVYCLWQQMA